MHRAFWRLCESNVRPDKGARAYITGPTSSTLPISRQIQNSQRSGTPACRLLNKSIYSPGAILRAPSCRIGLYSNPYLSTNTRGISWLAKGKRTPTEDDAQEDQEDATRAAILDKVMKGRQPAELMLRCNVKTISGQFKKSDICAEHRLHKPHVDDRLVTFGKSIRGYQIWSLLFLFGKKPFWSVPLYVQCKAHNLKAKGSGLPYEFRAIESIMLSVLSALEAEMVFIRNLVGGLLAEMEDNIDRDRFKRLLHYSRRLVEEAIDEILTQDEDMNAMHLTDKKNGVTRAVNDHEDLETLLESFSKQVEEIVNEAETIEVREPLGPTVQILMNATPGERSIDSRNTTLGIGTGALVAGLFGMNVRDAGAPVYREVDLDWQLTSHLEEHPYAFFIFSGVSVGVTAFVAALGLRTSAYEETVPPSPPPQTRYGRVVLTD
ncbi:magnesium ion transporter Mrs2 [Coprinopsis cinerea okayama7|uniref:Magnesium transporter n=1 Tax=Coprinopsis cinerea (strain Okayama-7 / 130 / ATCC MYA-4618 / FGSC 9003) TaxID=240176 RepID=A8P5N6_COPC7|nr:magnesium ion transporter Mrs2 [Coprinopsis cinerea okayama7\|eukprot:XP_001838988.2 magnesium ion transporter Mrs2 [Coprinopsis cinerea okayama7\